MRSNLKTANKLTSGILKIKEISHIFFIMGRYGVLGLNIPIFPAYSPNKNMAKMVIMDKGVL